MWVPEQDASSSLFHLLNLLKPLCLQDLRKRLDMERSQKEQYMQQLQAVREEITAAAESAQKDAAVAQKQVRHMLA